MIYQNVLQEVCFSDAFYIYLFSLIYIHKSILGGYGEVWQGLYLGKIDVAVKKMFNSENVILENDTEIHFLQRVRHPRLVSFFGAGRCSDDNNIFIVLEFMEHGSLDTLLLKDSSKALHWRLRLRLLHDVVLAMEYLHDNYDSIHRDLKSANILLTQEKGLLRAKVADFGTSRFVSTKMSNTITNDSKDSDSSTTRSPLQDTMSAESDTRVTMTSSEGT